jgi:nicotianamine synthase
MSFACEDVTLETKTDWSSFEAVFLAALVGIDTQSKISILSSMARQLKPGTLIVARSAHGLRSILYPVLHPAPAQSAMISD